MGQLYKGDVRVWINVPSDCECPPAELIDRVMVAAGLLAASQGHVAIFPEGARNVLPGTIEDWASAAKERGAEVAPTPDDAERMNALIDEGVVTINARQAAEAQAQTV